MSKFQSFILSSQQNAMCQRFTGISLLLQFTTRCDHRKWEMEKKDFPQVSRKSYAMMLHRSLESINFKWGAANFEYFESKIETKNSIVPRNLN